MPHPDTHYKKTRIAPTPSGFLHLGNVLSFAVTAALAHQHGAKVLLRIDDLDRTRVNKLYLEDIFDTLNFLNIPWHEGPRTVAEFEQHYSQLHRIPIYHKALTQLSDTGRIYACTCSRKQLNNGNDPCIDKNIPLNTANASWRLRTKAGAQLPVKKHDGVLIQATLSAEMHNFIVRKKDGFPAYQLTSIIDDLYYGIDLIVRGDDLWPSTLAQQGLATALGKKDFNTIAFYHHPLLLDRLGDKLSKSAGATSVHYLRESGKTPADIYTMIAAVLGSDKTAANWQQLAEIAGVIK
jgi:glutamyl/glutaminyl-tRNA synthetase